MAPLALPSLLMRHVPIGAPIFPHQLGTLLFPTTSSTHSLSPLCESLTSLHESGRFDPPFSYNELGAAALQVPLSLHQARTASHTHSSKSHSLGGVIFCFPSSTSFCASLLFRPLGSPVSSSRSSSAMVTATSLDSYRPISLASCAFKIFENLDPCSHCSPHFSTTRPFPGRFPLGCRRCGIQPCGFLAPLPSRAHPCRVHRH